MHKALTLITLAAVAVTGCGASDDAGSASTAEPPVATAATIAVDTTIEQQGDATMLTISGELAYRERIALIPGGTATVSLLDTSLQDVASVEIATITIELGDRQVPIPFELEADVSDLDIRGTYSLSARITAADGALEWTTDTANDIDITQTDVDLGMVMLVRAIGGAPDDGAAQPSGLVGEWSITDIDGTPVLADAPATLVFDEQGTVGGNTGCNSFSGTYRLDGQQLLLESPIAATLMACGPEANEQESAIFAILNDLATFQFGDDGRLTIVSSNGSTIIASR